MAHRKQILVLESEKLTAASILCLLASHSEHSEVDVTGSTLTSLAFLERPDGPTPDVVILEEAHLMANLSAVVKLADLYPNLRLIVFGQDNNNLHVFDKQMVVVRQTRDFLELL